MHKMHKIFNSPNQSNSFTSQIKIFKLIKHRLLDGKKTLQKLPKRGIFSCLHRRSAPESSRASFLTEFFPSQLPTSRFSRAIFKPLHSPAAAFLLRTKHWTAPCDLCCSALQGSAVVAQKPFPIITPGLRQSLLSPLC